MRKEWMAAALALGISGAASAETPPEWAQQIAAQGNAVIASVHRDIEVAIDQRAGQALAGDLSWIRVGSATPEAVRVSSRGGSASGTARGVNCAPI